MHSVLIKGTSRPTEAVALSREEHQVWSQKIWLRTHMLPLSSNMNFLKSLSVSVFKWEQSVGSYDRSDICEHTGQTCVCVCALIFLSPSNSQNDTQLKLGPKTHCLCECEKSSEPL